MKVIHEIAGYTAMGEPVFYFKVVNASGAWVGFTNWGARWIEAGVPDSEGRLTDVITGYDNPSICPIPIIWELRSVVLPTGSQTHRF